jgi:hypothetical protein
MRSEFVERFCLPHLLEARNEDGGWGFKVSSRSRAESTAWALLSLLNCASMPVHEEAASRAAQFLSAMQLPDGSWPSSPEVPEGSWVTSLVCLALQGQKKFSENVTRGLNWLCNDLPGDSRLFRRLIRRFIVKNTVAKQNDSYYGWSWTPGTSSWVEPTSYALILMQRIPASSLSDAARRRQKLGAAMLIDRMCPGGGWNCGNPMVYGVPGQPQIGPTVWALLALMDRAEQPEVQTSLTWLEENPKSILGSGLSPASLALTDMAMSAYGRSNESLTKALPVACERNQGSLTVPELAWAALALSNTGIWRTPKPSGNA